MRGNTVRECRRESERNATNVPGGSGVGTPSVGSPDGEPGSSAGSGAVATTIGSVRGDHPPHLGRVGGRTGFVTERGWGA